MRRMALVLALAPLLCVASRVAVAEEGLFVTRASGGVSSVYPDMPKLGQQWTASADLTLGERTGIIGGVALVRHREGRSFGLSLGIKTLLIERFWRRVYVHVSPELVRVWGRGRDKTWDVGARAGLGYEQLLMWGFGFVIEVSGSTPLGLRGTAKRFDVASAGATIGLFMEF